MTNQFTLESAREMTDQQLLDAMRQGFEMSEEGIRHGCVAIAVLEERGVDLPMLPGVYRYAREIAEGDLSAHAGLILGQFPFAIKAILPLPLNLQDEIADGKRIKVAVRKNGRMMHEDKTIFEMSQAQMRLVFSDDGITSAESQGEFLLKALQETLKAMGFASESSAHPKPKISVDAESGEIVVGRAHLTVDDLMPALAALGYVVKSVYGRKKLKPVKVK